MSPELQQTLALAIVALAATALLWRVAAPWLRGKKSTGCSTGCGQCPANQSAGQTPAGIPLLQIQLPKSRNPL